MKTIRIKFVEMWGDLVPDETLTIKLLKKHYNVEIVEDNPEYVVCSLFGDKYEYCKYDCVRIMLSLENYFPDLNLIDYAVSPYPVKLYDRVFSMPLLFIEKYKCLETMKREYTLDDVKRKKYFANFIIGHESEDSIRGDFFKELCKYKRVESAGSFLNNMPDGYVVNRFDDSKFNIQKDSKFTLCFESTYHEGFLTEKLADAFKSNSIPVYFGTEMAKDVFNEKAFIYVKDREHFKEAIDKIIELDNDDAKYLEMLNQPIFNNPKFVSEKIDEYEKFLCNIFDQPLEKAYRRTRVYWPKGYNDYLSNSIDIVFSTKKQLKQGLKRRKQVRLEKIRVEYNRRKQQGKIKAGLWYIIKRIIFNFNRF